MYKVTLKNQFRKDFARMKRRGMPLDALQTAITVKEAARDWNTRNGGRGSRD